MLHAENVESRPLASSRCSRFLVLTVTFAMLAACGPAGATGPTTGQPSKSSGASTGSGPGSGSPPVTPGVPSSAGPSIAARFDPAGLTVGLETVVDGLDAPLAVTSAGDGSGRIFVTEQGGQIRIVRDGKLVASPFLDISTRITSGGERGLLGLAFHPEFPTDPRIFVNYTDANGDTQVS